MKPKTLRQRARCLSRTISIPPGELLFLIADAGLTAVENALTQSGGVKFPLKLKTVETKPDQLERIPADCDA